MGPFAFVNGRKKHTHKVRRRKKLVNEMPKPDRQ